MRHMRLVKKLFNYDGFVNLVNGPFLCKGDTVDWALKLLISLRNFWNLHIHIWRWVSGYNPYPASFHARNWKRSLHTQDAVPLHSRLQQPHRPAFLWSCAQILIQVLCFPSSSKLFDLDGIIMKLRKILNPTSDIGWADCKALSQLHLNPVRREVGHRRLLDGKSWDWKIVFVQSFCPKSLMQTTNEDVF